MQDLFFWAMALIMIGLGGYTNYINWKMLMESRKAKETYLQNHKDAQMVQINKNRYLLFILLTVLCFGFAVVIGLAEQTAMTGISQAAQLWVYIGLGVFMAGLVPEAIMYSHVVSTPDGFMYETDFYRYKSINSIQVASGFTKPTLMKLTGNKEVSLPKAIAKWALPRWEEFKANRKANRRKKGK